MLLMFGQKTVDTKGLPRVAVINSSGSSDGTTCVFVLLESRTRAAVEKWAKRLGVEVAEAAGYSAGEREFIAEAESGGYRLRVYTYAPAAPVKVPADDGKDAGLPAVIAAAADPDTVVWVVDPKVAPECSCGCTSAFCRCCDPETCTCGQTCPVCDEDGGA